MKFTLQSGLFPFRVYVWLGAWDRDAIERWLRREGIIADKLDGDDPSDENLGCTYNNGFNSLLWMPSEPRSAQDIAILTHEAVHCAINAANGLGFKLNDGSDEFYCYTAQWIVSETLTRTNLWKQTTNDS